MPIFVDAAENVGLEAIAALALYASLHSAYSASGDNELTGGSYARQELTWDSASDGSITLAAGESFSVPAGSTVAWIGLWSAATNGTFYGMIPNGGFSPKPFTATTSDVFTAPGHLLSNGNRVVLFATAGTLPTGIAEGTIYWVVNVSGDTFQLSMTSGGSAIDLSAAGSGLVQRIAPEAFELAGSFDLSDITLTARS